MTNFNDTIKKVHRIGERLIELDVFQNIAPDRLYFSKNFMDYCHEILEGNIYVSIEEPKEGESLPSTEEMFSTPEGLIDIVMFYLIAVKKTPPEILQAFREEDYIEFAQSVAAFMKIELERQADPEGYKKRMSEAIYRLSKEG